MALTTFNPSPQAAAKVLADLADPANSLREVASLHNTSLEALCIWIASDEVQARLTIQGSAAASITRFLAANHTHDALSAIVTATRETAALLNAAPRPDPAACQPQSASSKAPTPTNAAPPNKPTPASPHSSFSLHPSSLPLLEFRRRLVESLRKNSNLIFRLTRFEFFEPSTRPRTESKPRAGHRPRAAEPPDINSDQLAAMLGRSANHAPSHPPAADTAPPTFTAPTNSPSARPAEPLAALPIKSIQPPLGSEPSPLSTAPLHVPLSFDLSTPTLPTTDLNPPRPHRSHAARPRAPSDLIAAAGC